MLTQGTKAPDFSLLDDHNTLVSLSGLKGKRVILYFYPKDDTPGCTIEAREFSNQLSRFEEKNSIVYGVSADSVASHGRFCSKHGLGIPLLSDPDHTMIEQYGAWREKNRNGEKKMGIVRSTILIDENGIVARVWDNVSPAGHAEEVLAALIS
jgi:peroxiredoxin Q/BCP